MNNTKPWSTRLSLAFVFDTDAVRKDVDTREHDACAKEAAAKTGLVEPDAVQARATKVDDLSLETIHKLGFDPQFHTPDGGPALRFEFLYDTKSPKMGVRVVTALGEAPEMIIDGVLSSRMALHTMELLEGRELSTESPAAREGKIPPYHFGIRQRLNFARVIGGALISVLLAHLSMLLDKLLGRTLPADPTLVTDAKSMYRFAESSSKDDPAHFHVYRAPASLSRPFRAFLALVEAWRLRLGLASYFYLMNFSPLVAPGSTTDVNDLLDVKKRYRGGFASPGAIPPPQAWPVSNAQHASMLVFNNYGVHKHNFSAKPVAFVWDWLELYQPLNGAGAISINGTFMCWVRGLPSALKLSDIKSVLGAPVAELRQNQKWFSDMGPPKLLASLPQFAKATKAA